MKWTEQVEGMESQALQIYLPIEQFILLQKIVFQKCAVSS